MRWFRRREARTVEPGQMKDHKVMELQTAKEILSEVFHAHPADVEEMIQRRLVERNRPEEKEIWQDEREERLWPATFCLGE